MGILSKERKLGLSCSCFIGWLGHNGPFFSVPFFHPQDPDPLTPPPSQQKARWHPWNQQPRPRGRSCTTQGLGRVPRPGQCPLSWTPYGQSDYRKDGKRRPLAPSSGQGSPNILDAQQGSPFLLMLHVDGLLMNWQEKEKRGAPR